MDLYQEKTSEHINVENSIGNIDGIRHGNSPIPPTLPYEYKMQSNEFVPDVYVSLLPLAVKLSVLSGSILLLCSAFFLFSHNSPVPFGAVTLLFLLIPLITLITGLTRLVMEVLKCLPKYYCIQNNQRCLIHPDKREIMDKDIWKVSYKEVQHLCQNKQNRTIIECPYCATTLEILPEYACQKVECPNCSDEFIVYESLTCGLREAPPKILSDSSMLDVAQKLFLMRNGEYAEQLMTALEKINRNNAVYLCSYIMLRPELLTKLLGSVFWFHIINKKHFENKKMIARRIYSRYVSYQIFMAFYFVFAKRLPVSYLAELQDCCLCLGIPFDEIVKIFENELINAFACYYDNIGDIDVSVNDLLRVEALYREKTGVPECFLEDCIADYSLECIKNLHPPAEVLARLEQLICEHSMGGKPQSNLFSLMKMLPLILQQPEATISGIKTRVYKRGLVQCPECDGKGVQKCPICDGTGKVVCYNCNGTGEERGANNNRIGCHVCNNRRSNRKHAGMIDCSCKIGFVLCEKCNGKKEIEGWATSTEGTISLHHDHVAYRDNNGSKSVIVSMPVVSQESITIESLGQKLQFIDASQRLYSCNIGSLGLVPDIVRRVFVILNYSNSKKTNLRIRKHSEDNTEQDVQKPPDVQKTPVVQQEPVVVEQETLSSAEQQYIELFKQVCADGQIEPAERKMLEIQSQKILKIPAGRVKELEDKTRRELGYE